MNWTTRDGRTIAIKDMADSHLVNATNMILRAAARKVSSTQAWYIVTDMPTAEMASEAFDDAIFEVAHEVPEFRALLSEVHTRGLGDRIAVPETVGAAIAMVETARRNAS